MASTVRPLLQQSPSSRLQRERALNFYYSNPKVCKFCGQVIRVGEQEKIGAVRQKNFCNKSCFAKFNNTNRIRRKKKAKPSVARRASGVPLMTKGELKNRRKGYQSFRSAVRHHAEKVFKSSGSALCAVCGYDKHVEVCHRVSVSSFPDTALVSEINAISNLVGLCPNHHWEFDNGLISV